MTNDRLKEITAELNRTTSDEIVGVSYGFKTTGGKTTDQRVIVFNVIRKKPLSEIPENERIPSQIEIDGEMFDTDVIEGIISRFGFDMCQPDFYGWQQNPPGNRNLHRPLMGGVSVTNFTDLNQYVGTLGFIAVDNETNSLVGVSNNHVLCNDAFFTTERDLNDVRTNLWTPDGHIATQPNEVTSFGPNNKVGVVKKYQPIYEFPTSNVVDCAAIAIEILDATGTPTIDPSVSWNQFGITGMTSAPRFATTQEIDTLLADSTTVFYSSGRTTGPKGQGSTKLFCVASNSSITIAYEKQGVDTVCYMNDTFELQASGTSTPNGDWCYYPSAGGDSGSAILSQVEGEWVIVGMLYGGRQIEDPENPGSYLPITSMCNRIDNIASALNISAWDGTMNGISYSNPNNTLTYVSEGGSSDKFKIINGLKYWQMGLVNNSEYPVDPVDNRIIFSVKTDNAGISASNQFTITTTGSGYSYDIETSDGQTITGLTSGTTITFENAGTYDVFITGAFPQFYFNNNGVDDKLKLIELKNFGTYAQGSTSQVNAFFGCSNLVISATDVGYFGSVTDFGAAWYNCSSLTSFPLIDTSSGTIFGSTWTECSSLTSFPLLDTSSGTNFNFAWYGCSSLTSFPLLDTSSGTNFTSAWFNCSSLTSFPLIDTSSGTIFGNTWYGCSSLTSFPLLNTSNGTTFQGAWINCSSLTSFPQIDTSSGTNFYASWGDCSSLTSFPLLDTSSGTDFGSAWRDCSSLTSFPLLDTSSGTSFQGTWQNCSSLVTFPANAFDTNIASNYTNAFQTTNLSTQSIDDILVSLDVSGVSNGTFAQSGGSTPSATGLNAKANLISKGWTITTT